jgi:hypothetical protein
MGAEKARALIIGLDGYAGESALTSAVRDAVQFRECLIERKLIEAQDAELLTLPVIAGASPATSRAIRDRLYHYYANGDQIDRFFFFFAGHGILANANASHTRTQTILVPTECEDFRRDAAYLWPFEELRETMERCGPREQFYIIDACRDLVEDRNPDVGKLGFSGAATTYARSQSVLFAVSPLGSARSTRNGLGVMTGHVIDALRNDRLALDHDDELGKFVITVQSVKHYVEAEIRASLQNEPGWRLRYQLPELRSFGPSASPWIIVEPPPEVPLTVHVDPDRVAAEARISVCLRGSLVQVAWPPLANHEPALLVPQRYTLKAQHESLYIQPTEWNVDLRRRNEVHFSIQPGPARGPEDASPGAPQVREAQPMPHVAAGTVRAVAVEAATTIELEGQLPPYHRVRRQRRLEEAVPPGTYRVCFRLGDRVQSETVIEVLPAMLVEVRPSLESSPLLHEALGTARFVETAQFSETIGPMQSGVLQTLLTMVGIKHVDVADQVFHQLTDLVRARAPDDYDRRPIVVVIALDGTAWRDPPGVMLRRIRCDFEDARGTRSSTTQLDALASGDAGYGRIAVAVARAPGPSFSIIVSSPDVGTVRLAAASLEDRATVVTIIFHPDGDVDIGQTILGFPGEHDSHTPVARYGTLLRTLQLAQLLYRGNELIDHMVSENDVLFRELMFAKWTDPVVTVMAFFARRRAIAGGTLNDPGNLTVQLAHTVAQNLFAHFGSLPDSRIVYALTFPDQREQILDELLDANALPVLADAAVELAARARETRRPAAVTSIVERLLPGQIWCMRREAAPITAAAVSNEASHEREV